MRRINKTYLKIGLTEKAMETSLFNLILYGIKHF